MPPKQSVIFEAKGIRDSVVFEHLYSLYLVCPFSAKVPEGWVRADRGRVARVLEHSKDQRGVDNLLREVRELQSGGQITGLKEAFDAVLTRRHLMCYTMDCPPSTLPGPGPIPLPDIPPRPKPNPPEPLPELHWIEFKLLDTGKPVGDVRLEVKLPNGQTCKVVTNAYGEVRIQGIAESGTCRLVIRREGEEEWTEIS